MSDVDVMTTSIVAALFFSGNLEKSWIFLQEHRYIPNMLAKSRFNRRVHKLAELFLVIFELLGDFWKQLNEGQVWRGYQASKKRYFYDHKFTFSSPNMDNPWNPF